MAGRDRVLIVGGGAVGLCAAFRLGRKGIPVTLFEKEPAPAKDLRASTFHPPTLDMLDDEGLAAKLIARGRITPSWQIRLHESHARAEFDLGLLAGDTAHPYRLQAEQWKLSELLLAELETMDGVELQYGAEARGLAQDGDGVALEAQIDGWPARIEGRFAIGADGAHSVARQAMGIAFEGAAYPETTLLVTTRFDFGAHLPGLSGVNYVWKPGGTFSLLHLPDLWRASFHPRPSESLEQALSERSIRAHLGEVTPAAAEAELLEVRPYRVHRRIAGRYRVGRVLLAGDAAHLTSPKGGMGLNGGLHDAFNLADKLAAVWHGADEALLDRYERQRRPIALEEIIEQAEQNRARMNETDPAARRRMLSELQALAADPARCRAHLLRTSMIAGLRRAAAIG